MLKSMTRISFVLLFCFGALLASEPWKYSINSNLTATMSFYSDNWSGNEANAMSYTAQIHSSLSRQFTPILLNKHSLKLAFGQTLLQDTADDWTLNKSTDLIDYETMLLFTLKSWVDPYISAKLLSQFLDEREVNDISNNRRYFNPLDITESVGIARQITKTELVDWNTRLGAAVREYIDRHMQTDMPDVYETSTTTSGGIELVTGLKAVNKAKWLNFTSLLKVYEALVSTDADNPIVGDDWRYPVVNWENTLTLNVTKYIMITWYGQVLYEKKLDPDPRLKNTLSIGLTYLISNE